MATPGSPCSMRIRVGTETPRRFAHVRWDSRRRTRANARFSPRSASARDTTGGSAAKASDAFDIQIVYRRATFDQLYITRPKGLICGQLHTAPLFGGYVRRVNHVDAVHGQVDAGAWRLARADRVHEVRRFLGKASEPVLVAAGAVPAGTCLELLREVFVAEGLGVRGVGL